MSFLSFKNVSKSYGVGTNQTHVLKNIDLDVQEGEFLVLLGFSGTGKTTLINLMAGLDTPTSGDVTFKGAPVTDLPHIWSDLNKAGLVSGHAYSKGLRTVKTCVGTDHCRFGTQNSTGLGIKLEKILWGSWTPHKVKLGVSGCPRNCAEATCKDIGVICVDSGYQIGIAGAAGMDVKETELLCQVPTEEECIEVIVAVTQAYRENAKYLDRIYKWVGKVGLDWVKEVVVDDVENRRALVERFEVSQSIYRKDPWAEHARDKAQNYAPLADLTPLAAE
ncbi:ATP-binding cassette domain-containing protein [Marivita geojedonensis]|uniref:ABC transporter domain-containing protein n=1 Tax=Marivita geojedonensis TaxID=1123756 RepID=A0A1X4NMP3_9RHOB|nr:ATP-binding cassette domain-containing protein [Marivita geojedonensis]OSQ51600.1 hypothetical protein MGEO_06650 [Marivita geojedonensis]PRY79127.1 ABC transporter family protein [Marivita geojedonensis]